MFGRALDKLDTILTWFEEWVLYLLVTVGLISLTVNVYLRYVHHYSLSWSEELIRHIIILTTFIGLSAGIKNRSMITIDALVQLAPRLRRPMTLVSQLAVLVFSVLIIGLGWDVAQQKFDTFQETIILEIPLGILFSLMPLMGVLMLIRTVQAMWKDFQETKGAE